MLADKCLLAKAVVELKHALARNATGQGEYWKWSVDRALGSIARAIQEHLSTLEDPQGRAVDVDTPLNPSPTVARRTAELRQDLDDCLLEVRRLRVKLGGVHPSSEATNPATLAGALSVEPEAADLTDFAVFCERVEQLLQRLEHYDEEEAAVIQQSINLDLGAGD